MNMYGANVIHISTGIPYWTGGITKHEWHQWIISSRTEISIHGERPLCADWWGSLTALIRLSCIIYVSFKKVTIQNSWRSCSSSLSVWNNRLHQTFAANHGFHYIVFLRVFWLLPSKAGEIHQHTTAINPKNRAATHLRIASQLGTARAAACHVIFAACGQPHPWRQGVTTRRNHSHHGLPSHNKRHWKITLYHQVSPTLLVSPHNNHVILIFLWWYMMNILSIFLVHFLELTVVGETWYRIGIWFRKSHWKRNM